MMMQQQQQQNQNQKQMMDDQVLSWDCLKDQKFLTSTYAQMSTEIANNSLLQDYVKICQDEIRGNFDIFNMMNQMGWYPLQMADSQEINQARNQLTQLQSGSSN